MIEKLNPVPHYFHYLFSILAGVVLILAAGDFARHGPWWHIPIAVGLGAAAGGALENGIIDWHEYTRAPWRFHCTICHDKKTRPCEFRCNSEKVAEAIADTHMDAEHSGTLDCP